MEGKRYGESKIVLETPDYKLVYTHNLEGLNNWDKNTTSAPTGRFHSAQTVNGQDRSEVIVAYAACIATSTLATGTSR